MDDLVSHCQLHAPIISFGITAGNDFYRLSRLEQGYIKYPNFRSFKNKKKNMKNENHMSRFYVSVDIFFDFDQIKIKISFMNEIHKFSKVVVLEFDFSSITSLNLQKLNSNMLTIMYHTPPKIWCGRLHQDGNITNYYRVTKLPLGAPPNLIDHVVNGSAIQLLLVEDISALISMLSFSKIQYTAIPMMTFPFHSNWMNVKFLPPSYMLLTVTSLGYPGKYLLHKNEEKLINPKNTEKLLYDMHFHICKDRSLKDLQVESVQTLHLNDEDYVDMRTAVITPHRIIFCPPAPTLSCYAFTRVRVEKIIEIRFRDENMRQVDKGFHKAFDRIRKFCENGFNINKARYNEFLCSNSKFKDCGSYFYEGSKTEILDIWKSFGEFEKALPAKISSRVGLNYTSVRRGIPVSNYFLEKDIKSEDQKYNFTDGCGQMSLDFARKLQKKLGIPFLPSAFQIRYPGFKGVLVVEAGNLLNEANVIFRKSQKKFTPNISSETTLDVVKYSSPVMLKFHKHMIELFCQVAGHHESEYKERVEKQIKKYFDEYKNNIINQSVDPSSFKKTLMHLPKYMDYDAMKSYEPTEFLSEYFLRSLVQADSLEKFRLLYEKGHIEFPAEYARTMFGVPDFSGKLKEEQVFIQYSRKINPKCKEYTVLEGKVAITKSPIYNSGDLRFVEAVDVEELHHLKDVLVFPTVGDRPIADQIGGGDMDGDEYSVIWDPGLMLPYSYPATDYFSPNPDESKKIEIDKIQEHLPNFRKEFMKNDGVGRTANSHLVLAEQYGFNHKVTKNHAKMLDYYLNYHKSGILPENTKTINCRFNPDHMRKDHQPMYRLNNLLGDIYRKSKDFYMDVLEIMELDDSRPFKDPLIDVKGWQEYENEAKRHFKAFKREVKMIMARYGIKTEGELFSGRISEMSSHFNIHESEINSAASVYGLVQELVNNLMKRFRKICLDSFAPGWEHVMLRQKKDFFEFYSPDIPQKMKQFAVACYNVAYDDGSCVAFPWILWDAIDCVRLESKRRFSGYPFASGVMEGANPRLCLNPLFRFSGPNLYKNEFLNYVTGILFHLRARAGININSLLLKNKIYEVAVSHSMLKNRDTPVDEEEKLNFILKFIEHLGITHFDNYKMTPFSHMVKVFRMIYLRVAFQKNPEIFKNGFYPVSEVLRLHKIIIEINKSINEEVFKQKLLEKSGCQKIAVRYLSLSPNWKKNSSNNTTHQYSILGYGSKDAITTLKNMLIVDMTNIEDSDPATGYERKVAYLTSAVFDLMQ